MRIINVPHSGFNALSVDDYYNSDDCEDRLVLLSEREVTVLRAGLQPLRWKTRFGVWLSAKKFSLADNGDLVETINKLEDKMACKNISESIEEVGKQIKEGLLALASKPCCGNGASTTSGASIAGILEDGTILYGTEPYGTSAGTETAESKLNKCAAANAIADGVISSLYQLASIASFESIAATTMLVLTVWSIIPFPPAAIPIMITVVTICWAASGALLALATVIENNREQLVCIVYSSSTPYAAIEELSDFFDNVIGETDALRPVTWAAKQILMLLYNADTIKGAFDETLRLYYNGANCSSCEPDTQELYQSGPDRVGIYVSGDYKAGPLVLSNSYYLFLGDPAQPIARLGVQSLNRSTLYDYTYSVTPVQYLAMEYINENGEEVYVNQPPASGTIRARGVSFRNQDPPNVPAMTLEVSWSKV